MIIAVVGPTCSGKSSLALEIAKHFNAEIINFDPFQCYWELNIGVAKPDEETLKSWPHHLINVKHIWESLTIFDFQKMFRETVDKLISENKNIVLVGGSGLYLRSSIYDYEFTENKEVDVSRYSEISNEDLFKRLMEIDPESAMKTHENNRQRVMRALAIYDETGSTKSELEQAQEHKLIYDISIIGLNPDREKLYENINIRVDEMFEAGLEEEVRKIHQFFEKDFTSLKAIGYKEFYQTESENVRELIKKNTRHYARRQMTFFKHQFTNINWFTNAKDALDFAKSIR